MREMLIEIENLRDRDREQRLNPHIEEQNRRITDTNRYENNRRTSNDIKTQETCYWLQLKEA